MTGDKLVDPSMSPQMCVSYCDGKGYSMAGLESGDTCFCANQLDHNGSMNVVDFAKCLDRCAGSHYEWCGGGRNLRLYTKTGDASVDSLDYNYPPAGAKLTQVYTADGSSVPVVSAPSTGSNSGSNSNTTPSTGGSNTTYGPNNPPTCSRRSLLSKKRKRDMEKSERRTLEAAEFHAKRVAHNRHARGHRHK